VHLSENARANVRACVIGRLLDLGLVGRADGGRYVIMPRGRALIADEE